MNMNLGQRKLMAFLHDPPEKAYDFTQEHEKSATALMNLFDVDPEAWHQHRQADWSSAAADRLPFPSPSKVCENRISFRHPLSGQELFAPADFPTHEEAWSAIKDVVPSFSPADPKVRFWLVWRLWMQFAAEHSKGRQKKAAHIPYLPADTRIPDHSIWNHMSMAAALESARGEDGKSRPAFLLFQLGPVQDFIGQARSTRDLWSGSYLLSWLMAHAMQCVAEKLGPDSVISPSLRGQPLFDWLNQEKLKQAQYEGADSFWSHLNQHAFEEQVLTPVLPNRFLAVVPADFDAKEIFQSLEKEWLNISKVCKIWLADKGCPIPHEDRWEYQIRHFWQAAWQLWPWPSMDETIRLFKQTPIGKESPINLAYEIAKKAHADGGYPPNEGWAWSAHYQLCQHRLDARRQTREFDAWQGADKAAKDDYSGKEEEVIDRAWIVNAQQKDELKMLFKKEHEHLGAPNLIKRIWHKAYLLKAGLKEAAAAFDSVPDIAFAGNYQSHYYAVLALDGDEMGKWISGEKTPPVGDVLCPKAIEYFTKLEGGKEWLETHRPVSPSYHLQFSEALTNFSLYAARRIVEQHHGQLIYSGGDDVLAMLPAEEAIPCARGLRTAFRGEACLPSLYPDLFASAPPGMIRLKTGSPDWPLLVPGTQAAVSVGLSIGHIKEPLQDMVKAAQKAEKRAKEPEGLGRNALAVSLFKRSGEQIEWGTKFIPEPFDLLAFLDKNYRAPYKDPKTTMPISGIFPYRICELLRKYEPAETMPDWKDVAQREADWAISQLRIKDEYLVNGLSEKTRAWLNASPTLAAFYNLFAVEAFIARQGEE